MTVFELLFLLLALTAVVSLLAVLWLAARGRRARAGVLLRRLALGAAVYFSIVVVTTAVMPRAEHRVGDTQCFDDWCITVLAVSRADDAGGAWEVSLELRNRSRGTPMGERGTVVYLTDAQGHRYDPLPDPAAAPFDRRLEAGEAVTTTRRFMVPSAATGLGLVYTHEGGFPIGWLVIGEGGWFAEPAIVRLE